MTVRSSFSVLRRHDSEARCDQPVLGRTHAGSVLLLGLVLLLLGETESQGVAVVSNSKELYAALNVSDVASIHLTQDIALNSQDWAAPLRIGRNVTVGAHPVLAVIQVYVTLDCASLARRISLAPGVSLTFRFLELNNYVTDVGFTMLLLLPSPGAVVVYDNVIQRRRAGFEGKRNLADLQALPRLPGRSSAVITSNSSNNSSSQQRAFYLPRFCP
ncbi:hypothetical protein GPECTOR_5g377 [Gonium pectorale]|uniref:Uncharacterized protein n=1 Tax=Gonium pectorale TaxID=33097 RepID=A0A150GY70_GONPE|nr:hypothetical protein GPECTOR_5g377 [Gonium pectorale]|eukprot:KXZ54290.1 hypothetical protein GPECTOR_5g377 [Gonium pectorale]